MPTRSIYLDEDTARLANELMETSGVRLSGLFREFLVRCKAAQGRICDLAVVQDCSTFPMSIEEDPYRLDKWVDLSNTKKVLLMSVTLRNTLVNYLGLWSQLLSNGARMQLLLQGGLDGSDSVTTCSLARMRLDCVAGLPKRKAESDAALTQLAQVAASAHSGTLEVRQSGDKLLTYSAIMIWKRSPPGEVDVQIHPYFPGYVRNRGPRFMVSTNESTRSFAALIKPIADLWGQSQPVVHSSTISDIREHL